MKTKTLTLIAVLAIAAMATGCSKEKTCRCAVPGKQTVRVIKIDKGECTQIKLYDYHTETNLNITDTLFCTDYQFDIDTIYAEEE